MARVLALCCFGEPADQRARPLLSIRAMQDPRTPNPDHHAPAAVYGGRKAAFEREVRELEIRCRKLSVLRLAVFSAGALSLALTLFPGPVRARWEYLVAALCAAAFLILVKVHDGALRGLKRGRGLVQIQAEALARLERRWQELPLAGSDRFGEDGDPLPAFAQDLDLFGRASLAQLLGTVETPAGRAALGRWLLEPAPPEEIAARQEAVKELAGEIELRQSLQLLGRLEGGKLHHLEAFLEWAESEPWWLRRPALLWLVRILTVVTPLAGGMAAAGWLPWRWFLLLLVGNLAFSYRFATRIYGVFAQVSAREGPFARYAQLFEHLSAASFSCEASASSAPPKAPRLRALGEALETTGATAYEEMGRLHSVVERSDLRFSSLHFLVQALTLWDFHVLGALERWQGRAGGHVRRWFQALGEWEALSALAGLAFDHPAWAWPRVDPAAESFRAEALGHPLLAPGRCVTNDVEVGPAGSFLLVTGSNMSGKSTLLRSVGVNAVLAQAGGPVCAGSLVLPPLRLGTSIRVEDSLEEGTSFFLAELQRLKAVVDAADAGGPKLLYLLDEILRGTNSAERQVAVRRVVEHLVEVGALGAVSTHDLELAQLPELAAAARPVHFRETLHSGEGEAPMTFDYRLRPGVATTRNALKLLELVGLVPGTGGPHSSPGSRT